MSRLSGLDSRPSAVHLHRGTDTGRHDARRAQTRAQTLNHVAAVLLEMTSVGEHAVEAKLGLTESARIALDVVSIAQHAKSHRKACADIAAQTYLLLSAVDGGVKGRAIDPSRALRAHVALLNKDLQRLRSLLSCFAAWVSPARVWHAQDRISTAHDILSQSMDAYLRLLHASLGQPLHGRGRGAHAKWQRVPSETLGRDIPPGGQVKSKLKRRSIASEKVLPPQPPPDAFKRNSRNSVNSGGLQQGLPAHPRGEAGKGKTHSSAWAPRAPPSALYRSPPPPPVEAYVQAARFYQATLHQKNKAAKVVTFSPSIAKAVSHPQRLQYRHPSQAPLRSSFSSGPLEPSYFAPRQRQPPRGLS